LSEVLPNFPVYAHMLGNFSVRIDGDTASSRVICFNPMVLPGDKDQVLFLRPLVRRRVRADSRGLADDPPRRKRRSTRRSSRLKPMVGDPPRPACAALAIATDFRSTIAFLAQ